jgi:putative colanic acid biosynthesis UDP-glucose lipid carrier transferase
MIVAAFMTKTSEDFSRLIMGMWAVFGWIALVLLRVFARALLRLMRRRGWNRRRIVVAGAGELGRQVARRLREASWTGLEVVAFVDDNPGLEGARVEGVPVRGPTSMLSSMLNKREAEEVWLALPLRAEKRMKDILFDLRHHTSTVRFVPDIFGFRLVNHAVTDVAGMAVLDLSASPMVGVNRLIKAIEDRVLAALILVLVSPLFLVIALGVGLTSPGPVFFKQRRHGWDGRPITVYKFRTMYVHQESRGVVTQARPDDSRVTPFGAVLRRTSLDELPQLINVLQGRMSLVGPRPHAVEHNDQYKDLVEAYMQRHKMKPGITGWAQVNGWRGETDTLDKMRKRVEYDLYYVEHWSLWFDLRIIFLTLLRGFIGTNAY